MNSYFRPSFSEYLPTEDMEVCAATQRGMRSDGYKQGRLSHLEEPVWHFQKYMAAKINAIGTE